MYKGHKQKIKEKDYLAWLFGQYQLSAVSVAVEHNLQGKKAKGKYIARPLIEQIDEENSKEISEKELQRQREAFVMRLRTQKINWDLAKQKEQRKENNIEQ